MFSMIYLIYHQCLAKYVLNTKARSCMYISVRDDKNSEFKLKKIKIQTSIQVVYCIGYQKNIVYDTYIYMYIKI